jgi:hypothetical protein
MRPPTSILDGVLHLLRIPAHHHLSADQSLDRWALVEAGFQDCDALAVVWESDDASRALELVENGHAPDEALRIVWGEQSDQCFR